MQTMDLLGSDEVFGYGGYAEPNLRAYQSEMNGRVDASTSRTTLMVMPTGSGKTITSCAWLQRGARAGRSSLFLAPRRELIHQTSAKLTDLRVDHGVLMAGELMNLDHPTQVASVPTLARRLKSGMPAPPADDIVIDEAHVSMGDMVQSILEHYPDARIVGMTATPARADGRGLGEIYDEMLEGPSVRELTALGHLVSVRYFAPSTADLEGVRIARGDYHQGDLSGRMNTPHLVGDVVGNWLDICPDRKTVVFAVDRMHAMALHQEFERLGVASAYLDGTTPNDERALILRRLRNDELRVVCSVDVLSYGWDEPSVSCAIIARPTRSIARYLQSGGRILRPFPGKEDAILIDHSGVVRDLGFLDDDQPWSLDPKTKIRDRIEQERKKKTAEELLDNIECPECSSIFAPQRKCPECGHDMKRQRARRIEAIEAELQEVRAREEARERRTTKIGYDDPQAFMSQLLGYAVERGFKPGWAFRQYEAHFQSPAKFPGYIEATTPSPEVRAWCKSRLIRFARGRKAA